MLALTLASGCVDTRPSAGRCTGTLRGETVVLAMDGAASQFHRDDDILGDDDGPFAMHYGDGALRIDGELDDMPTRSDVGTHDTSGDRFHRFEVSSGDEDAPSLRGATMTVDEVRIDRLTGATDLTFDDGSDLHCTYDLRRAFELDTDD